MELGKIILAFAITMALSIGTLTVMINNFDNGHHDHRDYQEDIIDQEMTEPPSILDDQRRPSKSRVSRFLAGNDINPRAITRCTKRNGAACAANSNTTCCNNNCVDLMYDDNNCGRCNTKCRHMQKCCRGSCVYISYDPRHCGECNHRCRAGDPCFYGLCNY